MSQAAHPVRLLKVGNGSALSQELGVAQDLKVHIGICAVPPEHLQPAGSQAYVQCMQAAKAHAQQHCKLH